MAINREILARLLAELPLVPRLRELHVSLQCVIAQGDRHGLATFARPASWDDACCQNSYLGDQIGCAVAEIADRFADSEDVLHLGLVTACLNGSLPLPADAFVGNAFVPFAHIIKECRTCFVGHFSQGEAWRAKGHPVSIVELEPRDGDIHWNDSKPVLAEAEVVFITGMSLVNGTFLEVLDRTPRAKYRVLLGQTVPFSRVFFGHGIHLVGSTLVSNAGLAIRYCQHGGTSVRGAPAGAFSRISITNQPELKVEVPIAHSPETANR